MRSIISIYKTSVFIKAGALEKTLKIILAYIALPSVLFVLSMALSLTTKIIVASLLIFSFLKASHKVTGGNIIELSDGYYLKPFYILAPVALLTLSYWSLFNGNGFVQDWCKHRSVLFSLYQNPFNPTLIGFVFSGDQPDFRNAPLVYYYGMYLPSVYLVKILDLILTIRSPENLLWCLAFAFFIWNLIGLVLVMMLFPLSCKKLGMGKNIHVAGNIFFWMILALGSLRYWYGLLTKGTFYLGHTGWILPYFSQIPPIISIWQWAPNQLIVGMLSIILILLYRLKINQFPLALYAAFIFADSPWLWIGLLPIILYALSSKLYTDGPIEFVKKMMRFIYKNIPELLSAALISMIAIFFYNSKQFPTHFMLDRSLLEKNGFLNYLLYLFIEFAPVALIIILGIHKKISMPWIIRIQCIALCFLPLFEAGLANDLVWKSSIPSLLLVMFYCVTVLQKSVFKMSASTKILIGLYLAAVVPLFINEFYMGLESNSSLLQDGYSITKQYQGKFIKNIL